MGNLATYLKANNLYLLIAGQPITRDPDALERAVSKEWKKIEKEKKKLQRSTHASVEQVWDQTLRTALGNFDRNTRSSGAPMQRADEPTTISISQILSVMEAKEIAGNILRSDITKVIKEGFRRGTFNAGFSEFEFNTNNPLVQDWIRKILGRTKGIGETTVAQLGDEIEKAISEGANNATIRNAIRKYFKESAEHRIATIAQTVTNTAYESGQIIGFSEAGIKRKKWVSVRDGSVRPSHFEVDGDVVGINERFEVGNSMLLHPSDPAGPAHLVINCRCSMLPMEEEKPSDK